MPCDRDGFLRSQEFLDANPQLLPPPPPPQGRFIGPDGSLLGSGPHGIIMEIAQNTGINWLSITFEPYGLEGGGPSVGPFLEPLLPPSQPRSLSPPLSSHPLYVFRTTKLVLGKTLNAS